MTPKNGWTFETLLRYVIARIDGDARTTEQRFLDHQVAVDAALNATKEAVLKAEIASEKRFESVNEFHSALSDQQRTLLPRVEAEQRLAQLADRIDKLERAAVAQTGQRAGLRESWGWIVGLVAFVVLLLSLAREFLK
jgi:hypothetical protein